MRTPIFVSRPTPFLRSQIHFIDRINQILNDDGFEPLTLGERDNYTSENALPGIRELMLKSNGIICVAFRRTFIEKGKQKPSTSKESEIKEQWTTSPFCHIETAMAYMLNLPTLILTEKGVLQEGVLEQNVTGFFSPNFDINDASAEDYLESNQWKNHYREWKKQVYKHENDENQTKLRVVLAGQVYRI
ncbi:hypothetical protein FACS18948_7340 [Clostridia bacterium]|nr:hypothetical protein FACS18948_7340 [Clostridia bacterium]